MDFKIRTESSARERSTRRERVVEWVLINGDRKAVAGCLIIAVVGVMGVLIWGGVLAVGPDSSAATLFGSGVSAGVVTLVTIALSINQLILSRVFGTVTNLSDRLEGSRDLRQNVETLTEQSLSPNDPVTFLSLIAMTLSDRASDLLATIESTKWNPPAEVTDAVHDFVEYGQNLETQLQENPKLVSALGTILGPGYAVNMAAAHHLQNKYEESLPEDAQTELQAIDELFESIAIVRQFYKTILIQRNFADLSRLIVYSGLVAFLTAISLTLIYRTTSVTLPTAILPVVISVGLGVIVSPLALFTVYLLRAATIARQTASVGPFVPPDEVNKR